MLVPKSFKHSMEVPKSFKQIGSSDSTSSVSFPFLKFTEIHDSEEGRMINQARLAHRLKREIARRVSGEGQSSTTDRSDGKSGTRVLPTGSGLEPPTMFFSRVTPVKLQLHKEDEILRLTYVFGVEPCQEGCGTLEAHVNGFLYYNMDGSYVEIMNANVQGCYVRLGDRWPPLLLFHLHHPIIVENEWTKDIHFYLPSQSGSMSYVRSPKELDDVERAERAWCNDELKNFVSKIEETQWTSRSRVPGPPITPVNFQGLEECQFGVRLPTGETAVVAVTYSGLVLIKRDEFIVVALRDILIVNLAHAAHPQPETIDMAVVFKDLQRPVCEFRSIPFSFLIGIKHRLNFGNVKYYVNNESRDWKSITRNITETLEEFVNSGGCNFLDLEDSRTLAYYPQAHSDSDFPRESVSV